MEHDFLGRGFLRKKSGSNRTSQKVALLLQTEISQLWYQFQAFAAVFR